MKKKAHDHIRTIEAILFMYGREISCKRIAELTGEMEEKVKMLVQKLQEDYELRNAGLRIMITNHIVQMVTHPDVSDTIEAITKKEIEGPLTPVSMEVLSIIAYRGPIGKIDIEAIRGVNCSFTLRNLLRRGLIERVDNEAHKRSQSYYVTVDFLRILGVQSVQELPEFVELSTDKRIDAVLYNEYSNDEEKV